MKIDNVLRLINRQLKENIKIYGISLMALFGMLSFMFILIHQWQDSFAGAVQNGVFIIGLFISGGLFTNSMFQGFSNKSSTIWYLSLPSKHSEKVLASIIISTIIFLPCYLFVFYLVDVIYLLNINGFETKHMLNLLKDDFYVFIFFYLIYNGVILLGRVVFTKYSLIKTVLVGILCFMVLDFFNNTILKLLLPDVKIVSSIALDSFLFTHQNENVTVFLPHKLDLVCSIFVRLIMPMLLWVLVWLKLREKQV